jgi:citrate lyase subunit beta/citryl-CoA lyase
MTNRGTDTEAPLPLRSMLFVPGDSEKKLAKAATMRADALILDLEDSVDPTRKDMARSLSAEFIRGYRSSGGRASLWIRISTIAGDEWRDDLASVMPAQPSGIVLPKPRSVDDVLRLASDLDDIERRLGIACGRTRILPIATETPAGVLNLGDYPRAGPRLAALTWGAEDLSLALGASTHSDERGEWLPTYQLVRSLCLLAAGAAGVPAIDTVYTNLRDTDGLLRQARAAYRDGFTGKLAIHPDQVDALNDVFAPGADAIADARRVVEAFTASKGTGVVSLDGRMLDQPNLTRAHRILEQAAALDARDPQRR